MNASTHSRVLFKSGYRIQYNFIIQMYQNQKEKKKIRTQSYTRTKKILKRKKKTKQTYTTCVPFIFITH